MSDLTDADLSRLLTLCTVHGGHLDDVPHGVLSSYRRLCASGLVTMDEHDWGARPAEPTPLGCEVAGAMLETGRQVLTLAGRVPQ